MEHPDDAQLPEGPSPTSQLLLRLFPKGELLAKWREETHAREHERVERMSRATAESVPLETLLERMRLDERLSDMFREAVDAAVRTGDEDKLRLLGRALADGSLAADDAAVDEAQQMLRTAVELEAVDLRALIHLRRHGIHRPWFVLRERLGLSAALAGIVMARLQRLGLVDVERDARLEYPEDRESDEVELQESYALTAAADALLDTLRGHRSSGASARERGA